jgi:hypothetical protein
MRIRIALVALALLVGACGTAEPDHYSLTTPGVTTGDPNFTPLPTETAAPEATATATATPTPTPKATPARKPVTKAERRVIKAWADELRHGHVAAAARLFQVPSIAVDPSAGILPLGTREAVKEFNAGLPCGAKLLRTRRSTDQFVVGIFRLTERPGSGQCGAGTGHLAAVAFRIEHKHITRWVRVEDPASPDDTPSPTPDESGGASGSATATPTPTPTETATPTPTPASTGVPGLA